MMRLFSLRDAVRALAIVGGMIFGMVGVGGPAAQATPFTTTVPNGNGAIPSTYPEVGGTLFVLIGASGNIYYQFVNPSTQFQGFQNSGTPVAFRGNPFQLGPTQALNCGPTPCSTYFGGAIVEGYVRLTARDGDSCPGDFDQNDLTFRINGINVTSFTGLAANSVERTNFAGTTSSGFENCFRNQGANETSTGWIDLTPVPGLLNNILTTGSTTPTIFDDDPNDNFWFFRDGNDASGTPEVAPGISIEKTSNVPSYSAVGDAIVYSFDVENIGSVTLNNVQVTDPNVAGINCPLTTLASGQSMTCTANYTITQENIDASSTFTNTALVSGEPTEGTLGNVSGEVTITGPAPNNAVTLAKAASPDSGLTTGDAVTYTYTVVNTGTITLTNVTITDSHGGSGTLSSFGNETLTNTSGLSNNATPGDGVVDFLSPGDSATFEATYDINQADFDAQNPIANTASVVATPRRGTFTSPTASESVGLAPAAPQLTVIKTADNDTGRAVGEEITYTYTVTNSGNVTINSVTIADAHNGENTPPSPGSELLFTDAAPTGDSTDAAPNGTWDTLAPGDSVRFTGTYTVTQQDVDTLQ
ncbi:MAG: hypothetical protein AAFQ35_10245 [Pseudomonadota bacterium]